VPAQVILLQIFFSPRFMHVVEQLWRGPIFAFYSKLYIYFVAACVAFPATWSPTLTRLVPALVSCMAGGMPLVTSADGAFVACCTM
jgi:hypothetical protein